jgi:hypothetical protein
VLIIFWKKPLKGLPTLREAFYPFLNARIRRKKIMEANPKPEKRS